MVILRERINTKSQLKDYLNKYIDLKVNKCQRDLNEELASAEKKIIDKRSEDYLRCIKKLKPVAFEFNSLFKIKSSIPYVLPDTVSDWDFQNTGWQLDSVRYMSPPSSLKSLGCDGFICHYTGAWPIKEGRIISYFYLEGSYYDRMAGFLYRHQGTSDWSKCYRLNIDAAGTPSGTVWADLDGSPYQTQNNMSFAWDTWLYRKVTFWESESHLVSRWSSDGDEGVDFLSNANKYSTSTSNYAGITLRSHPTVQHVYGDDTEIWKAS